jgi:hypothetical protein
MNGNANIAMETEEFERHLRELLAPNRLPANVKSARYELGTDHIGEPEFAALLEKDKKLRDELGKFREGLTSKILELESGYFPFIRLAEAA